MVNKTNQIICSLKNGVCEKIQVIFDFENNTVTINPENCLECPVLQEKIRKSVIVLPGSSMIDLYRKAPTFMIDFDLQLPKRTIEIKQ
ncbi:MAG: hypothetical protein QW279_15955 [Candidatus Jordarchaeaceae archaeon]